MTDHPEMLDAGPYVVGSLEPAERAAFGEHLRGCAACQEAVAELAGMPAMLDLVPADVVAALAEGRTEQEDGASDDVVAAGDAARAGSGPPGSVLEALLRAARAEEARDRRRRWWGAGLAAAAVTAVLLVGRVPLPWTATQAPAAAAVTLAPTDDVVVPVTVSVELAATEWGTRLAVSCAYRDDGPPPPGSYGRDVGYALVLTGADGTSEQVATWSAVAGDVVVPAATRLSPEEITRIDLRTVGGATVLTAEP